MICTNCHTQNLEGDRFCESCGAELPNGNGGTDESGATLTGKSGGNPVLQRVDGGQEFSIGPNAVIGRLDSCDVPANDKSVSREHARISRVGDRYVVEDLGSTNGTMVNGQRIHDAVLLVPGDTVSVGSVDFLFQEAQEQLSDQSGPTDNSHADQRSELSTLTDLPSFMSGLGAAEVEIPVPETPVPETPVPVSQEELVSEPVSPGPELQPAPVPAAAPAPAFASPVIPPSQTHDSGDPLPKAMDAMSKLWSAMQAVSDQMTGMQQERSQLLDNAKAIDSMQRTQVSINQAIDSIPASQLGDIRSLRDTVQALAANPKDIDVLMKVARQASSLSRLVSEYEDLRAALTDISDALRSGLR